MAEWNIKEIESLSEDKAKEMAIETMVIKSHNIYFVDFKGYFGYSALVFKNNHQIYHANDYELHWSSLKGEREKLKEQFIKGLNRKLYTEEELGEPIKDYDDYTAKAYYLRNYYILQIDYITAWCIGDKEQEELKKKVKDMVFNPISFCYVNKKDVPFCKRQAELLCKLETLKDESEKSFDYMKDAFLKEMYNHEYCINWDADVDTLSAFGNIPREVTWNSDYTLNDLFDALKFTDTQREAYKAARRQYYKEIREEAC